MQFINNLVNCEWVHKRLAEHEDSLHTGRTTDVAYRDIEFILLMCLSTDDNTVIAATGALAMLSYNPIIARKMIKVKLHMLQSTQDKSAANSHDNSTLPTTLQSIVTFLLHAAQEHTVATVSNDIVSRVRVIQQNALTDNGSNV